MARNRAHDSQFSCKNHPLARKKRTKFENYSEEIEKKQRCSASVQLFKWRKRSIDSRECRGLRSENPNLKETFKTIQRSLGKCYFRREWKCKYLQMSKNITADCLSYQLRWMTVIPIRNFWRLQLAWSLMTPFKNDFNHKLIIIPPNRMQKKNKTKQNKTKILVYKDKVVDMAA